MISIQSRPDALCARSFLQLRTIFCRFAVLLDFRGFRCYSVTTRSGHLILCGAICGVLALFHLPAKYIAFFCAIFILLLACVSAKYLKGSRYAVRSFLHFFSKQSFRMLLVHRVLLVFVVLPAAISVFLASVLCVRYLFRFPCHIINHIRLYIKAIGNLYLRQRRTIQSYRFGQGGDLFRNALANLQDTPPKVPASAHRCGTHSPCRRPDTFRI